MGPGLSICSVITEPRGVGGSSQPGPWLKVQEGLSEVNSIRSAIFGALASWGGSCLAG